jgi:hypothetical protein
VKERKEAPWRGAHLKDDPKDGCPQAGRTQSGAIRGGVTRWDDWCMVGVSGSHGSREWGPGFFLGGLPTLGV